MEVSATYSSRFTRRMLATPNSPTRKSCSYSSKQTLKSLVSVKATLSSCNLSAPFVGGTRSGRGSGSGSGRRGVITRVIPFTRGSAWEQIPPDLASYLYKNRIVYLGMSLVPSVTELLLAEFLYLQYDDAEKPIYMYINSTGTTKGGQKLAYDTEAFAIYDTMRYVTPPIFTLCVGNAWGEAALLLAAGAKGNRSSLPSGSIMIKEPIARFRGQATDVEISRKEVRAIKNELVNLLATHSGKTAEQLAEDIRIPKYFTPTEAIEYGLIDKVLYNDRASEDSGVVSELKKAELI